MAAGAGSAILKRLAALNRSGVLAKPLQYSQVKADLASIDEESALRILNQLEVEAASVPEPLEYVKNAVGAVECAPPGDRKRKADGNDCTDAVVKRVRLLNSSGKLSRPIVLSRVTGGLSSIGLEQAVAILKGLESIAPGVTDPTGYINTAVRSAGGQDDDDSHQMADYDSTADGTSLGVKQEPGHAFGAQSVKAEVLGRDFRGAKTEDLSEIDRIERHIGWLNRNKPLMKVLDANDVLPALDCIGFRQAMRVLRRFEENCETLPEPADYINDLVARSGWIWAKPDIVDEDEKVAKRVSWLNQFGGLQLAIDYAQVADMLDGLKVAHAMVLLRELEVQSHQIDNPTEYIKRQTGSAGKDEAPLPAVPVDSSVARRIASLNQSGVLAANIELQEVGSDLARLGEADAAQLLNEVESKGKGVKDPTGFIKFKMKAKLAALGPAQDAVGDDTKILKRIEWLNDYGGLMQDIDYNRVSTALEVAGLDHSMSILKELEDSRKTIRDPNTFIMTRVKASWKVSAGQGGTAGAANPKASSTGAPAVVGHNAGADFKALTNFMSFLAAHPRARRSQANLEEVATLLDSLGPRKASQVMAQMQDQGLGLDDPLTYIRAVAQRSGLAKVKNESEEDGDDVAKITKRLKWLNQFAGLSAKIKITDVVGALYCLGIPQTMEILRGLQEKASKVKDPTKYIKASVQRANGVQVTGEEDVEPRQWFGEPVASSAAAGVGGEMEMEEPEDGMVDFAVPEGDEDAEDALAGANGMVEFEVEEPEGEEVALEDEYGVDEALGEIAEWAAADESAQPVQDDQQERYALGSVTTKSKMNTGPKRVVGGLSGATGKLVPTRSNYQPGGESGIVKNEEPAINPMLAQKNMLMTPQEKLVKVRNYALKRNLVELDPETLKQIARLSFPKARDLINECALGGRDRKGVRNPSTYLKMGAAKLQAGLGVEQGIAMELAVSLGVILNNDCLDELASVPRRQVQQILRDVSQNSEAKLDPLAFIQAEVLTCRAQMDARPWPPAG